VIRWATVDDAEDLADTHVASWQKAYAGIFPEPFLSQLDRGARARWWRRHIDGGASVLVSNVERVVGFCTFGTSDDDGWGEIFAIYVHPEHWGDGHGYELLLAGEEALRERSHERALLWVLEANERGRLFYERQGWRVGMPIRVEDIGGVQVTELRYEKNLTTPL
jgi:ribosomal protein S18 acetylase RimI-like enzyme